MVTEEDNRGLLDDAAIALHEMYEAYVRAGFTVEQAMELVTVHLMEIIRNAT